MNQLTLENLLTNADAAEEILKYLQPKYRSNLQKSGRSIYDVVEGASSIYTNNVNFLYKQGGEIVFSYRDKEIQFKFNLLDISETLLKDVTNFLNAVQNQNKNASLTLEVNDYMEVLYKDNIIQIAKNVIDAQNTILMLQSVNEKIAHTSIFDRSKGNHLLFNLEYDANRDKIQLKLENKIDKIGLTNNQMATITYNVLKYNMVSSSWILALEEFERKIQQILENFNAMDE
jgi:hypothetical protein